MLNTSFAGEIEAPPGKFQRKVAMNKREINDCNEKRRGASILRVFLGILALICAWALPASEVRAENIPSIVVGLAPIKYLVTSIAGDKVMVSVVLPGGGDPHTYEPSAIQMGIISDADYYFSIRQPFEEILLPKLADSAPRMKIVDISAKVERLPPPEKIEIADVPLSPAPANATMVGGVDNLSGNASTPAPEASDEENATEGHGETPGPAPEENQTEKEHDHAEDTRPDPHIWLSPANMKIMAKAVLDELTIMLPAHGPAFNINYEQLIADINALDASIHALLDPLPEGQRAFLSFHPSWGYFARDYKLTQIAVEMEGYEPSPQMLARIIEEAKIRHARTILLEQQFATSLVKTLAEELNANVVAISSLTIAWRENLLNLAEILAKPPQVPAGFYDDVDKLNTMRTNSAQGASQ